MRQGISMNKRKKVIFITSRLPFPPSSGRKNVMYNYCKILNQKFNCEIIIISYLENGDSITLKPDFIKEVIELPRISSLEKLKNLIVYTFIQRKQPMQVSLFYSKHNIEYVQHLLKIYQPDIVIADMVRTTEYLKNFEGYKIADLDDRISIRYFRQLKFDLENINPYGSYLFTFPKFVQNILQNKTLKRRILLREAKLLDNYEKKISNDFDKTIFVATKEAEELNKENDFNKAISVPLGVDYHYFNQKFSSIKKKPYTISFLGALNVAHNETGIIYFIKEIFPIVRNKYPEAKLKIIGKGITTQLKSLVLNDSNIEYLGFVDDIRVALGESNVFVCPLLFGSGIKTKNLEAMAIGVPVVTSTIGAENINAIHQRDWIIADSPEDFSAAIIKIFENDELYNSLRENASEFVKNHFTWKVAEEKLKEIFIE